MVNGGWRCYKLPASSESHREQLIFVDVLSPPNRRRVFYRPPILEGSEHLNRLPLEEGWERVQSKAGRIYYQHTSSGYCMFQHPKKSQRVNYCTGQPQVPTIEDTARYPTVLFGKWVLDDINAGCQLSNELFRERRSTSTNKHEPKPALITKEPERFIGLQPSTGSDAVFLECDVGALQNKFIPDRWRGSLLYQSSYEPMCLRPHELGKTCPNCTLNLRSHPNNSYFREWSSAATQPKAPPAPNV
ncbi:hypothetical protein K432DRAFT_398737 [Lepidopterella palustris CBS 459.81]|uniref:WW domain-containing protein n=1 Tax=Lepidopterella palustris CBS 459.81 TaxID=1314670 RepID=A0A8E2DXV1_9PEZI|nr:hypothetical protein K432DRAFT_398737 [Lepidopterella palustris CBS 459.81]